MNIKKVEEAIEDYRAGKMVILVDDEDRENEGDLCMAAEKVTPEAINFMAKHGRGLICLAMDDAQIQRLGLPMMVKDNQSPMGTAFTISIEARRGVTTGISAADRATTVRAAVNPDAVAEDIVSPGHIFPLRARDGGVLVRTGQTEGAVDLARLAGLHPSGIICEIMNDDGTMARMDELDAFSKEHELPVITVADLIAYRCAKESLVRETGRRSVRHPSLGDIEVVVFETTLDGQQHFAFVKGDIGPEECTVRVQVGVPMSASVGDFFGRDNTVFDAAMAVVAKAPRGVILFLESNKPSQSHLERLENLGQKRAPIDESPRPNGGVQRQVGMGAQILRALGLRDILAVTNHPRRLAGLGGFGLNLVGTQGLELDDKTGRLLPKSE